MKYWIVLALVLPISSSAQELEIEVAGSHPVDAEVLSLVRAYTPHLMAWTSPADRDMKRRPMVVPGYFYHDMNGDFVGFDELTERHTKNNLTITERRFYDVVLHQFENTAILTYKAWTRGADKGKSFEGYGSAALIMTKTSEGWRAVADIVGQAPPPPSPSNSQAKPAE